MNVAGTSIARRIAAILEDLREHEKTSPSDVDQIVGSLVAHLRSWRPESVSPLGTLPAPTDPLAIRDPRRAP